MKKHEDLSSLYSGAVGPTDTARRRNLGIYYTPPHAAAALAKWAIRDASDSVLEPSFGGCALLGAAVERLKELGALNPSECLQGFDVDPAAFLHLYSLFPDESSLDQFKLADFLTVRPAERNANVILANPPFVAYRQMIERQRQVVREWRRDYLGGFSLESALWLYFLAHSLQFLKEGGRIAFVLPSSFLASNYAAPVRERLDGLFRYVRVVEVNERLFASVGAQERTCLLLAEDYCAPGWGQAAKAVHVVCETLDEECFWGNPEDLPTNQKYTASESKDLLDAMHRRGGTRMLGEFLHPFIGEVTGDAGFFVKSKEEWNALNIPSSELTAVVSGSRASRRAIATVDDSETRFMLTPSSSIPGRSVALYLSTYSLTKIAKNVTFSKRNPWWNISCCTTADAFVPSLNNAYFKLIVNGAKLACTNSAYRLMRRDGSVDKYAIGLASLTSVAQLSAELLSRKLGGGALKLEPSDVSRVALPTTAVTMNGEYAKQCLLTADALIRDGRIDDARMEADRILLLESGLMNEMELDRVRERLMTLRRMRLKREARGK